MDTKATPSPRARRSPSKLYAFAVVALATLLVMLVLWRPPVLSYTAESSVRIETAAGGTPPAAEAIFTAAESNFEVSPGVTVELAGHSPPGRSMLVQLSATAPTAELAQQTAAQATEAFLTATSGRRAEAEQLAQLRDEARATTVTSRVRLMEAERKLEEFLAQHFAALEQAAQPSPTTRPNPAWEELESQRLSLEARLETLRAAQTEQHPEYRHVAGQIAAIQAAQQNTPPTMPADENMLATAAQRAELRRQHAALTAAAEAARTAHSEAQHVQQQATAAAAASASAAAAVTARVEEPARVATLATGKTSRNMLLASLLLALALGVVMAVLTPKRIRRRLLYSVSEVAALLRLPIVGVLGSGLAVKRPEEPRGRQRLSRWVVLGCEFMVLTAVVLVVIGAVAWPGWAAELKANPLSAVQHAVVRVVDATAGR